MVEMRGLEWAREAEELGDGDGRGDGIMDFSFPLVEGTGLEKDWCFSGGRKLRSCFMLASRFRSGVETDLERLGWRWISVVVFAVVGVDWRSACFCKNFGADFLPVACELSSLLSRLTGNAVLLHVSYTREVSSNSIAPSGFTALPRSRGCDLKPIGSAFVFLAGDLPFRDCGRDVLGVVFLVDSFSVSLELVVDLK